jgi:hypothetical protein
MPECALSEGMGTIFSLERVYRNIRMNMSTAVKIIFFLMTTNSQKNVTKIPVIVQITQKG